MGYSNSIRVSAHAWEGPFRKAEGRAEDIVANVLLFARCGYVGLYGSEAEQRSAKGPGGEKGARQSRSR